MTMHREMNMESGGGGVPVKSAVGGAELMGGHSRCRVQRNTSTGGSFLGLRWRGTSWPGLMQLGVLLILVNSIALCSCSSSISINSQSSSISKNTVLGAHEEAEADLSVIPMAPTMATTTTPTPTSYSASRGKEKAAAEKTGTDYSSAEARRKEKKGTSISNDSSYNGNKEKTKGSVRINVSNNTTAPVVVADPAKNKQPKTGGTGVVGKEYWNKQQKVAAAMKGAKKGKYKYYHLELLLRVVVLGWGGGGYWEGNCTLNGYSRPGPVVPDGRC